MGEVARRLTEVKEIVQDLVGRREYGEFQRLIEHRFTDIERDVEQERGERKAQVEREREERQAADQELKSSHERQGTNWRQAIYAGLIPGVLFLITVLLQLKGGV